MAYVYKHIRLDTNDVFYIGIGKDDIHKKRSLNKSRRSVLWKKIVNKTDYIIGIIESNISWEEACEKEKELIKMYGKIIDGTGTLVNITSGGDGGDTTKNRIAIYKDDKGKMIYKEELAFFQERGWKIGHTLKSRKKSSIAKIGKKYSDEVNKKKGRPGYMHEESTKQKISLAHRGVKKSKVECPKCHIIGAPSPMYRWHFDNCRQ